MKGIQKVKDLYMDRVLLTFDQLCEKYQIPSKHFFKYLQLKSYMSSRSRQIMHPPLLSKIEEVSHLEGKGLLSTYYNLLMFTPKDSARDKLSAWRGDIQEDLDEAEWNEACLNKSKL